MKPTLVILAAGMGSRYGGLKQLDQLGPSGETILEYSIYDAIQAGFGKVVFIIRPDFAEEFKQRIGTPVSKYIDVGYVYQTIDALPTGFLPPADRVKPWGTGHALLVSEPEVRTPFAILNADDFYGRDAFVTIAEFLSTVDNEDTAYAMVGYRLENTLSEHGTVSRGECEVDQDNFLIKVTERTAIARRESGIFYEEQGQQIELPPQTPVSMNFWGFTPRLFEQGTAFFREFLQERGEEMKSEFYIPSVVTRGLEDKALTLKVLDSDAQWFGVTYREDKDLAVYKFAELVKEGVYPETLWT